MPDINRIFQKFINNTFPVYKGCNLEVVEGGYKLFGTTYPTLKEVDKAIIKGGLSISHSINRLKQNKNDNNQEKDGSETS